MIIGVIDKMELIIWKQKFWRILSETQKPLKSEILILVKSSSKDIINLKPEKISGKRSSSIFKEKKLWYL